MLWMDLPTNNALPLLAGLLLLQLLLTSSAQRLRVALLGAQAARLQRAQALGAELARGEGGGEQTSFQMPSDL